MNFYWIYNLPNWLFAIITISVYILFGVAGLFATRNWVRRLHKIDHSHNDIVGYYLAAVTVFYGITLGLVAVGTWDTFSATSSKVDDEAQVVASIYRDVNSYNEPWKSQMRQDLRAYTYNVIHVSWPQQRRGIVPSGSGVYLDSLQKHLMSFQPKSLGEQIIQAEVFKQYNELVECRRARLNAIHAHLSGSLWAMVILGGLICIVVTFFFDTRSFGMHFWMTSLLSALLGLLIFLIATMDNPFRGELSVSSEPMELVYHQLMKKDVIIKPASSKLKP
ncbi:MAG: DUF4239 domain-containing protein [Sphingobacteriaceae bacterium]|nr:MAG: DUF4239 domain-containing protein [Sphingobacteriaceae bacterium]